MLSISSETPASGVQRVNNHSILMFGNTSVEVRSSEDSCSMWIFQDEFEKRTEFFDDFHEDGETENDSEFHQDHEMSKGGHFKTSHEDFKEDEGKHGKESKYEKGKESRENSGHKKSGGQDVYDSHEVAHGEKVSHEVQKSRSHSGGDDGRSGKSGGKSR